MDKEIEDWIYNLNKSPFIKTTNSCAGHDKFESNAKYDFVSHPYLAFLVNEIGWDLFWGLIFHELCAKIMVHIYISTEDGKSSIIIRCCYEDKVEFWEALQPLFNKYFIDC